MSSLIIRFRGRTLDERKKNLSVCFLCLRSLAHTLRGEIPSFCFTI